MNATYPTHEILLDQMSLAVFGEEYKLCNSSQVCSCSDIFLLGPSNPHTTLCWICVHLRIRDITSKLLVVFPHDVHII